MSASADHHSRLRSVPAALAVAGLLALAGCGDDAEDTTTAAQNPGADTPTSTNLDPSDTDPTIPDLPQNDDPSAVVCTGKSDPDAGVSTVSIFNATEIVGEPVKKAQKQANSKGCAIRVAMEDGEPLALTQDFRPDRVNVAIEDGKVTEIIDIG